MSDTDARDDILLRARELGFDLIGVAAADLPPPHDQAFADWIQAGMHADMKYLSDRITNNITHEKILANTQSIVTLAVNYWRPADSADSQPENAGQISRYAITRDYHKIIKARLKKLVTHVENEHQGKARAFVDIGPLLERGYAETVGIGYVGRNAMIITPEYGSWVFLAVLLTDLKLPPTPKRTVKQRCGECVRCIDACPTDAIVADRVIDSRRCISYLTIENRGPIPEDLRPQMGNWIFGCDVCQDVCPHNGRNQTAAIDEFCQVRFPNGKMPLTEILGMQTREAFLERFAGTPIMRAKREGIVRNACVAAGNSRNLELLPHLEAVAENDPSAMVQEHAKWAIEQLRL